MSRLRMVAGNRFEELLDAAPGAFDADTAMRRLLIEQSTPRLYSLFGVTIAGLLGCERFVEALRGPLDPSFAAQAAPDWRALTLTAAETDVVAYVEKGTLD